MNDHTLTISIRVDGERYLLTEFPNTNLDFITDVIESIESVLDRCDVKRFKLLPLTIEIN